MKLLIYSTLRHLRKHIVQTIMTLAVTVLITAVLSDIFHTASSFQSLMRTYALAEIGDYHFKYTAPIEEGQQVQILYDMEEFFSKDPWFSNVELCQEDGALQLLLTVSSPGIFTSKGMDKRMDAFEEAFHGQNRDSMFMLPGSSHNFDLLVSCFDLSKENGIYAFMAVFLLIAAIISVVAIFTLGAVFQVSVSQRERDFALFASTGASSLQIRAAVLFESAFYIIFALPAGYFMGILFFRYSKSYIDSLLSLLDDYPPIKLAVSVPYSLCLFVCAAGIILISGMKPADRASKASPMEILQRTHDIVMPGKGREGIIFPLLSKIGGVEGWLAMKSYNRFRRRRRPILLVLSVTFMLCIAMAGFRQSAGDVIDMIYSSQGYNISAELYSDSEDRLSAAAAQLTKLSQNKLMGIRQALFALREPYPFSGQGRESAFADANGMQPDIMLLSVGQDYYKSICRELGISVGTPGQLGGDAIKGIFLNTQRTWMHGGRMEKGYPFELEVGDMVTAYSSNDWDLTAGDAGIDIQIAAIWNQEPLFAGIKEVSRLAILIPEDAFLQIEAKRPFAQKELGMHCLSLRGSVDNTDSFIQEAAGYLDTLEGVGGSIQNFDKAIQKNEAGVSSFEFLCTALIVLLSAVCISGNFTVSWASGKAREKEFATFLSVGMKPGELRKMKVFELLFGLIYGVVIGLLLGMVCYCMIYYIYTSDYSVPWHFPWNGVALGIAVLCFSVFFTEASLSINTHMNTMADMLRESD